MYLPDGRGRHRTANVPGDFAAHRGATAAATTSASVRCSMSFIQEQPTEGVRPNARENGQIRLPDCCPGAGTLAADPTTRTGLVGSPGKRNNPLRPGIHLGNRGLAQN